MRKFLIFIILGIFFLLTFFYFVNNVSPFDTDRVNELIEEEKILDEDFDSLIVLLKEQYERGFLMNYLSPNAFLGGFLILTAIFNFFNVIHLFIDKLFFKNFYETPSLFDSTRRGILLCVILGTLILLNLYKVDSYTLVLIPTTILLAEIIFSRYFKDQIVEKFNHINERIREVDENEDSKTETGEKRK